jgi:hypothetical protein
VVYLATDRCWLAACCCAFLASLTRPVGILLAVVMAIQFALPYLLPAPKNAEKPPWPAPDAFRFLVSLCLVGLGPGVYMVILAHQLGDPLAFLHAESHWQRALATPWLSWTRADEYGPFSAFWLRAGAALGVDLLLLGVMMKLRPVYSLLGLIYAAVYLSAGRLESVPRLLSVLFPFYITLARVAVRWPWSEPLLLAGSTMLLALSTILFVNGYWFT